MLMLSHLCYRLDVKGGLRTQGGWSAAEQLEAKVFTDGPLKMTAHAYLLIENMMFYFKTKINLIQEPYSPFCPVKG